MSSIEKNIIRGVPLFARLDDAEVERLSKIMTVRGCLAGVPLFEAGDVSDAFYIISRGSIRIKLPQQPQKNILLSRGDFFGEMGVVRGTSRSADAIVEEDSVLLEIKKSDFDNLLAIDTAIAEKIVSAFIDRCNAMTSPEPSPEKERGGYVPSERACRVVSFFSPSGGDGTTSLSVSMAVKARQYTGKSVMLVDGDLFNGAVHSAFNSQKGPKTAEVFQESEISGLTVEKYRRQLHYGVDILPSPLLPLDCENFDISIWKTLVNNAAANYDYLFIDTPSCWNELNKDLFALSDEVFFVVSPEVIAVQRLVKVWESLSSRSFPMDRIKLLINKHRRDSLVKTEDMESRFGNRVFAKIAMDSLACSDALNEGTPVVKRTPKSRAAVDISRAIRQLLCLPPSKEEEAGNSSFSLWNLFS